MTTIEPFSHSRNVFYQLVLVLTFTAVAACNTQASRPAEDQSEPRKFLSHLLSMRMSPNVYSFMTERECWISSKDAAYFATRIYSDTPSASVKLSSSSSLRNGSTEGDEAAFLLLGFRRGVYPPSGNSGPASEGYKKELLAWWSSYVSGDAAPEGKCVFSGE